MSKYSLDFEPGSDDRLPEWLVCLDVYSAKQVTISKIVFHSTSKDEANTMLDEFRIAEQAEMYELFETQESEFDYV